MQPIDPIIKKSVQTWSGQLKKLAQDIHANPELGFQEHKACAWQTALLKEMGFTVTAPFAGLKTAYKAVFGKGKPVLCIMAEYDALPGLGHGCGHNLIAPAAIGAGKALAEVMAKKKIKGTVVVMGTPAEESKGGKVKMIKKGALKHVDAAIMAHPSFRTVPDTGCNAIVRYNVSFAGRSAHAAASPEKGLNALDAASLMYQGIGLWRQQLPETSRMHGIINEGGVLPNIIPDRASCVYYLRSPDDKILKDMVKRFKEIARGAALMTGTTVSITSGNESYKSRWPNGPLNREFVTAAKAAGLAPTVPQHPGRASSDFGDVSQKVPGAHCYFGISETEIAGHSKDFLEAAGTEYARTAMRKTAQAVAQVGLRFMQDHALRRAIQNDFNTRKKTS